MGCRSLKISKIHNYINCCNISHNFTLLCATLRAFTPLYATLRYFTPLYATLLYLGRPPCGTGIYNAIPNQMWHSLNMDDWRHFPLQIWFIMSIFFLWSWISWHVEVQELKYNMSRIRWYVKDNIMQLNFDRVVDEYCQEVVFFLSIFQILLQPLFRPGPNVRFASLWVLFATGYQFMRHQI